MIKNCCTCRHENGAPFECGDCSPIDLDEWEPKAEQDPNGIDPHAPGAKLDQGKVMAGLLQLWPNAIESVMAVDINWEHLPESNYDELTNDFFRYFISSHMPYAAFFALARVEYRLGGRFGRGNFLYNFSRALMAVCELGTFGAVKYTRGGWRHVKNGDVRYLDAGGRHMLKEALEDEDPDSGLAHDIATAWNMLSQLELSLAQDDQNHVEVA